MGGGVHRQTRAKQVGPLQASDDEGRASLYEWCWEQAEREVRPQVFEVRTGGRVVTLPQMMFHGLNEKCTCYDVYTSYMALPIVVHHKRVHSEQGAPSRARKMARTAPSGECAPASGGPSEPHLSVCRECRTAGARTGVVNTAFNLTTNGTCMNCLRGCKEDQAATHSDANREGGADCVGV